MVLWPTYAIDQDHLWNLGRCPPMDHFAKFGWNQFGCLGEEPAFMIVTQDSGKQRKITSTCMTESTSSLLKQNHTNSIMVVRSNIFQSQLFFRLSYRNWFVGSTGLSRIRCNILYQTKSYITNGHVENFGYSQLGYREFSVITNYSCFRGSMPI